MTLRLLVQRSLIIDVEVNSKSFTKAFTVTKAGSSIPKDWLQRNFSALPITPVKTILRYAQSSVSPTLKDSTC